MAGTQPPLGCAEAKVELPAPHIALVAGRGGRRSGGGLAHRATCCARLRTGRPDAQQAARARQAVRADERIRAKPNANASRRVAESPSRRVAESSSERNKWPPAWHCLWRARVARSSQSQLATRQVPNRCLLDACTATATTTRPPKRKRSERPSVGRLAPPRRVPSRAIGSEIKFD